MADRPPKCLDDNGVTWKGLVSTAMACMAIAGSLVTWGWSIHASRPHAGAAMQWQVDNLKQDISADIHRIEQRQVRIEDKIDAIREKLNGPPGTPN